MRHSAFLIKAGPQRAITLRKSQNRGYFPGFRAQAANSLFGALWGWRPKNAYFAVVYPQRAISSYGALWRDGSRARPCVLWRCDFPNLHGAARWASRFVRSYLDSAPVAHMLKVRSDNSA